MQPLIAVLTLFVAAGASAQAVAGADLPARARTAVSEALRTEPMKRLARSCAGLGTELSARVLTTGVEVSCSVRVSKLDRYLPVFVEEDQVFETATFAPGAFLPAGFALVEDASAPVERLWYLTGTRAALLVDSRVSEPVQARETGRNFVPAFLEALRRALSPTHGLEGARAASGWASAQAELLEAPAAPAASR